MNHYLEGYVRARRVLDSQWIDHARAEEIVIRQSMRIRVGHSLVTLGNHLMGVSDTEVRPAA
ncbi:MAG TPA: hypothetical protein VLB67_03015 [Acidimicrobiia bacterium]|nr:hypothetical protein [Acidimicrobiia bacterium]